MPSAARRMKLNEAFDAMDVTAEIRLVELAQVLAERFPKIVTEEKMISLAGVLELLQQRPQQQASVQRV